MPEEDLLIYRTQILSRNVSSKAGYTKQVSGPKTSPRSLLSLHSSMVAVASKGRSFGSRVATNSDGSHTFH